MAKTRSQLHRRAQSDLQQVWNSWNSWEEIAAAADCLQGMHCLHELPGSWSQLGLESMVHMTPHSPQALFDGCHLLDHGLPLLWAVHLILAVGDWLVGGKWGHLQHLSTRLRLPHLNKQQVYGNCNLELDIPL